MDLLYKSKYDRYLSTLKSRKVRSRGVVNDNYSFNEIDLNRSFNRNNTILKYIQNERLKHLSKTSSKYRR